MKFFSAKLLLHSLQGIVEEREQVDIGKKSAELALSGNMADERVRMRVAHDAARPQE